MTGEILEFGLLIFIAFFGYVLYDMYRSYRNCNVYERRYVAAYRVGLIKQKAEENNITLELPPLTDKYVEKLESDIEQRINRVPTD